MSISINTKIIINKNSQQPPPSPSELVRILSTNKQETPEKYPSKDSILDEKNLKEDNKVTIETTNTEQNIEKNFEFGMTLEALNEIGDFLNDEISGNNLNESTQSNDII